MADLTDSDAAMRLDRVGVAYEAHHVLEDVSLEVAPGACVGLVGESGAGKSTVLKLLAGLVERWSGSATVLGEVLAGEHRSRRLRRSLQMIFQDPYGSLHPRHSVRRILIEPLAVHAMTDRAERVAKVLGDVGLSRDLADRLPHELSGGQRQRVAIARALILEPRVLLLDEPTSALDVSVQAGILNLLARLRRERALTCLFVSHNLAVVAHMCDRVLVMADGRIVEDLTPDAVRSGRAGAAATRALIAASRRMGAAFSGLRRPGDALP